MYMFRKSRIYDLSTAYVFKLILVDVERLITTFLSNNKGNNLT